MKKKIGRALSLLIVFIVAVGFFCILTGNKNADRMMDMGNATLPRVVFDRHGEKINPLVGYVDDMEVASMRDSVTPVEEKKELLFSLLEPQGEMKEYSYQLMSLDGKKVLYQKKHVPLREKDNRITLKTGLVKEPELVLKITLEGEEKKASYYTRLVQEKNQKTDQCIALAKHLHEMAIGKVQEGEWKEFLEGEKVQEQDTLEHVTLKSGEKQIFWGNMLPQVKGNVDISLVESKEMYSSVVLRYQVHVKNEEGQEEVYQVKEFFKIRMNKDKPYLLDYDRKVGQYFDGASATLKNNRIDLGIRPLEILFLTSPDGKKISFVQERELWNYNQETDAMSLVFSFQNKEIPDVRDLYEEHMIQPIHIEEDGSTAFAVCGYMNRGVHEGQVGAGIYYYNSKTNVVEEKAFLPTTTPFLMARDTFLKQLYYNAQKDILYVMLNGNLYQIDLKNQKTLAKPKLVVGGVLGKQYAASEDGKQIAFVEEKKVVIMDFEKGSTYEIQGEGDKKMIPLGFIRGDAIIGVSSTGEKRRLATGTLMVPMEELRIYHSKNKIEKQYRPKGSFIKDIQVVGNMITVHRVSEEGDVLVETADDYITNNKGNNSLLIKPEVYQTKLKMQQMEFQFVREIVDEHPKFLQPKFVRMDQMVQFPMEEKQKRNSYFVYGQGLLQGSFQNMAEAIAKADQLGAVVVGKDQKVLWEKGNRDLQYIHGKMPLVMPLPNESALSLAIRTIATSENMQVHAVDRLLEKSSADRVLGDVTGGSGMNLSGCSLENIFYIINQDTPVLMIKGEAEVWILCGYTKENVAYLLPGQEEIHTISISELENMWKEKDVSVIGYAKK